jgi:hypothetical protein
MPRVRALLITVLVALTGLTASADPYPVLGEPVLKQDSQFTKTDWGYVKKSLNIPAGKYDGKWPVVFTMEGYAGATRGDGPNAYVRVDDGELGTLP